MTNALLLIAARPQSDYTGKMRLQSQTVQRLQALFWGLCYELLLIHYYLFHCPAANPKVGQSTLEAKRLPSDSTARPAEIETGNSVPDIVITPEMRRAGGRVAKDLHVSFSSADIVVDMCRNHVLLRQTTFGASLQEGIHLSVGTNSVHLAKPFSDAISPSCASACKS